MGGERDAFAWRVLSRVGGGLDAPFDEGEHRDLPVRVLQVRRGERVDRRGFKPGCDVGGAGAWRPVPHGHEYASLQWEHVSRGDVGDLPPRHASWCERAGPVHDAAAGGDRVVRPNAGCGGGEPFDPIEPGHRDAGWWDGPERGKEGDALGIVNI